MSSKKERIVQKNFSSVDSVHQVLKASDDGGKCFQDPLPNPKLRLALKNRKNFFAGNNKCSHFEL